MNFQVTFLEFMVSSYKTAHQKMAHFPTRRGRVGKLQLQFSQQIAQNLVVEIQGVGLGF